MSNFEYEYEKDKQYLKDYLIKKKSSAKSKSKYKRVCLSPLRYAGGKSKAVGLILENLPKLKEKKIVSPFFGGGSFELALTKELGYEVIGYDIFGMLVNFWNILVEQQDDFVKELKNLKAIKEDFTKNRHILLEYWNLIKPEDLNYKTKKVVPLTDKEKKRFKLQGDKMKFTAAQSPDNKMNAMNDLNTKNQTLQGGKSGPIVISSQTNSSSQKSFGGDINTFSQNQVRSNKTHRTSSVQQTP